MTSTRFSRLLVLVFSIVVAAAATAQTTAKTPSPANVVNVTDADNGKDIELTTTQTLQVSLKATAGTGYSWSVLGDPGPLKLMKQSTHGAHGAKPGASQLQVFRFSASSPGIANLALVYRRSWEYNTQPAKKFEVKVNVR